MKSPVASSSKVSIRTTERGGDRAVYAQMNSREPLRLTFSGPRNWLGRVAVTLVGLTLAVVAFFFLTLALMAGAVLLGVFAVRWWWVLRRVRSEQAASAALEGEYIVVRDGELSDSRRVSGHPRSSDRY